MGELEGGGVPWVTFGMGSTGALLLGDGRTKFPHGLRFVRSSVARDFGFAPVEVEKP